MNERNESVQQIRLLSRLQGGAIIWLFESGWCCRCMACFPWVSKPSVDCRVDHFMTLAAVIMSSVRQNLMSSLTHTTAFALQLSDESVMCIKPKVLSGSPGKENSPSGKALKRQASYYLHCPYQRRSELSVVDIEVAQVHMKRHASCYILSCNAGMRAKRKVAWAGVKSPH